MSRILLVDDTPANRALAVKLLHAAGHEVIEAEDGPSGIELARQRRPDLVLMDLSLPEVDGWETLRRLRAERDLEKLPVVAFTAHSMVGDRERTQSAGFNGYVSKPIDAATFVDTVAEYLR